MTEIHTRVAAGAAWLDKKAPGWEKGINLDTLNISSVFCCPLGQTFGEYWKAVRDHNLESRAISLGFTPNLDDSDDLNDAWKTLITKRLEKPVDIVTHLTAVLQMDNLTHEDESRILDMIRRYAPKVSVTFEFTVDEANEILRSGKVHPSPAMFNDLRSALDSQTAGR